MDVTILEEISAKLGVDIIQNINELIDMKNILKIRIKNNTGNIENYERYFDY